MLERSRAFPIAAVLLLAFAVHAPLLLMQLPIHSYDANTHLFFSAHYAQDWFNPWNEKWFAGFSQTTYPPLVHQWIALFSHIMGLPLAYMFVQMIVILLLTLGVYRYARLWVEERAAGYAAIGAIFLGSLAMLVYQSGQINSTFAAALTLNALPYFYEWMRLARGGAFLKGVLILIAAAAGHHVTTIFGLPLFALPVVALAIMDRRTDEAEASVPGILSRVVILGAVMLIGIGLVLLPYWVTVYENPITQQPIPHASRDNYILNPWSGMNFWVVPHGFMLLALPYVFFRGGSERRLMPLFFGWFVTLLFSLGGTTPFARVLGRYFEILTFERFTFWATLMALPFVGLLALELIRRFDRKAVVALATAAVLTFAFAVSWMTYNPISGATFESRPVVEFLNRDDHSRFRYLLLGFGNQFSKVSYLANASTVDGDYNSARLLPELTQYGTARLDNAKYYGTAGMESLRAMLKHADQYGLKYIFVRDRFYEPLLAFAGWRSAEIYDNGNVTLWVKEGVPPARRIESPAMPTYWQRMLWGTLPMLSSILAIVLVLLLPERRRVAEQVEFPARPQQEPVLLREAK